LAGWPPIALASAELYNPSVGKWTTTGSLSIGRFSHMATLLQSGQVLVVGGECNAANRTCSSGYTPSAELYDPSTGKWTTTGSLIVTRYGFEALSLGEKAPVAALPPATSILPFLERRCLGMEARFISEFVVRGSCVLYRASAGEALKVQLDWLVSNASVMGGRPASCTPRF